MVYHLFLNKLTLPSVIFLSVWCLVYTCVLFNIYTISIHIVCVSSEELTFIKTN